MLIQHRVVYVFAILATASSLSDRVDHASEAHRLSNHDYGHLLSRPAARQLEEPTSVRCQP